LIDREVMVASLRKQLGELFPERVVEANVVAFDEGYQAARMKEPE
ncbi:MAG: hypothetical protein FJ313_00925, partial [Gemmatimonadetes bacterium]|nr:hypothetical protein [Gemmatimonadota bacterium]